MNPFTLQDIFNGNIFTHGWFRQQVKVLILLVFLTGLYIYTGFAAQRQHSHLSSLKKELLDAQYTLSTKQALLIQLTRQSTLAEELKNQGSNIQENHEPIIRIQ